MPRPDLKPGHLYRRAERIAEAQLQMSGDPRPFVQLERIADELEGLTTEERIQTIRTARELLRSLAEVSLAA